MPASSSAPKLDALQKLELRSQLLSLPFQSFALCMGDLLTALGYQEVKLTGRTQWKGRNQNGGHDMEANLPSGLGYRRVIVQVKQFGPEQRVYQRSVDELRGVALREWAGEALLLTSGPISSAIVEPEGCVLPVRVMDGNTLLDKMAWCRVGVREVRGRLVVDGEYFDFLLGKQPHSEETEPLRGRIMTPPTITLTVTLPIRETVANRRR